MNPADPSMAPAATPVPIHDIAGPVWFWPYPLWMTVAMAVFALLVLGALALLAKKLLSRKAPPPTNRQRTLAELEKLRAGAAGADPYAFGVAVSDTIRNYIQREHGLGATTQTSIEFLETIRSNAVFTANEKEGLEAFLGRTDLLKFARSSAGGEELLGLLDIAARLVRGEAQSAKPQGPA